MLKFHYHDTIDSIGPHELESRHKLAREMLDREMEQSNADRELLNIPGKWALRWSAERPIIPGPRHQTLRRRGLAPRYPRPEDLTEAVTGTMILLTDGIMLDCGAGRAQSEHIPASVIKRVLFHQDVVEIFYNEHRRALVQTPQTNRADVAFQAFLA